jgi:hypothetical protein
MEALASSETSVKLASVASYGYGPRSQILVILMMEVLTSSETSVQRASMVVTATFSPILVILMIEALTSS